MTFSDVLHHILDYLLSWLYPVSPLRGAQSQALRASE